jgi:hypothetical protein
VGIAVGMEGLPEPVFIVKCDIGTMCLRHPYEGIGLQTGFLIGILPPIPS